MENITAEECKRKGEEASARSGALALERKKEKKQTNRREPTKFETEKNKKQKKGRIKEIIHEKHTVFSGGVNIIKEAQ